ncbi:hypothetical protein TrLO_g8186 [Triparma laevis f. longispina]|uniref:Tyrosine-protein kinase ephrin type A/B receptor-like domain-containing protein n=1 Tax=Triparma laevis f. longispina TaxID=1714387 RepID=A0A9W7EFX1_9STRA|nr:hypothetical protein TrLO_g8186 [Triparma laevis f. longispina]
MIGLRTQRSSAPTEGPEDVTAIPEPSKSIFAREMEADKGRVSGTEGRRNVEAHEDEGVCTASHGLQCAEKRTELESEELLKLDSRNGGSGDALTFSEPSETIPVKEITSDMFRADEADCSENIGEIERVENVDVNPLTVTNEGRRAAIAASGLSETIPAKKNDADSSNVFHTDEIYRPENVEESKRVKRVGDYPLTVSNEGMGDVTTSFGLSEMTLAEQSADGSEHFNARLQNFGNTAEPKTKKRYKTKRRSLFKQQLRTCRLVFVALILLSLLGHVNADAPASSHGWDFRNCVTGQDVLDTGDDGGKTASPINGPTCSASGISLDGNNDYININESWEWGGTTSFEVYVKYDSFTSYSQVFNFGSGVSSDNVVLITRTTSAIRWEVYQASTYKNLERSNFDSSTWTHVIATVSGNTMKVYKNGVLAGTKTDGWEPRVLTRTNHNIGAAEWDGMKSFMDGTIAYVKMWHGVELQQSDVTDLYAPHNTAHHFWDFRGCTTGGTVTDSIAGDLVATPLNGPVCGADGLRFDGNNDYVDLDDWEWGGTTSIEVYVKYDSFNSASRVFDFGSGADSDNVLLCNYGTGSTIQWSVRQGSADKYLQTSNFDSSTWTHVVATVSGTTMKVYKNGILAGTKTDGWEPNVLTRTNHIIGASNWGGMNYFMDGTIAYVKMWHGVELQQAEVSALAAARCFAGEFISISSGCSPCPLGSYSESSGAASCTSCPSGKTSFTTGATSDSACFHDTHSWNFMGCSDDSPVVDETVGSALAATAINGASCSAEGMVLDGVDDYVDIDDWEWGGTTSIEVYVKYNSFKNNSNILYFGDVDNADVLQLSNVDESSEMEVRTGGAASGSYSGSASGFAITNSLYSWGDCTYACIAELGMTFACVNDATENTKALEAAGGHSTWMAIDDSEVEGSFMCRTSATLLMQD